MRLCRSAPLTLCSLMALIACTSASAQTIRPAGRVSPFFFEENVGQGSPEAAFVGRGTGYNLEILPAEAVFWLAGTTLRMQFAGARRPRSVSGIDGLPGTSNYFRGNDPSRWRTGLPTYAKVRAASLYPGIDVVYYGRDGALEYDLLVRPGADPSVIGLSFTGAESLRIGQDGDLVLSVGGREIKQRRPLIYQQGRGARKAIDGCYAIDARGHVRFKIRAYDKSQPLVIDPVVLFASYFGGSRADEGSAIAVDHRGATYLTGFTTPVGQPSAQDIFLTKFDPTGSIVLFTATFGGSGEDYVADVAVDGAGAVYIAGETQSPDFPTWRAFQPHFNAGTPGSYDGFVIKLHPSGATMSYSTYLGGTRSDGVRGVAVRRSGEAVVAGFTESEDFPMVDAVQPKMAGVVDAFAAVLNADGTALLFSTFLGGQTNDFAEGVAVDADGNVIIVGSTQSSDFPVMQAFQPVFGGVEDAFVAKFHADDWTLVYSTYLGGDNNESGRAVAVGRSGAAVACGTTFSPDFPLVNAMQAVNRARLFTAFVTKLDPSGAAEYSTYLGGEDTDGCSGVAVDRPENAVIVGMTNSDTFPVADAFQPAIAGESDGFIAMIDPLGSAVTFSSYLGGGSFDALTDVALDYAGGIYVAGATQSTDFPVTPRGAQRTIGGLVDAIVAKIGPECGTDVTPHVSAAAVLSLPLPPFRLQLVLIRNDGAESIGGPLSLALADLRDGALAGAPLTTTCTGASGTPFVIVPVAGNGLLAPGEIAAVWLLFVEPGPTPVTYRPVVISGIPGR